MGLRDFLDGMKTFNEGIGQYAEGVQAADQRQALKDLQTESPSLIATIRDGSDKTKQAQAAARYNELAMKSGKAKDDPLMEQVSKFLFTGGTRDKDTPWTEEEIVNMGLPREKAQQLAKVPKDAQMKAVDLHKNEFNQGEIGKRQDKQLGQQRVVQGQKQAMQSFNVFDKDETMFRDTDQVMKNVDEALKSNSVLGDNIAFGYIARNVAMEKGPLSDTDVNRIAGMKGWTGSMTELREKIRAGGPELYETMSPAQKDDIKKMVAVAAKNFQAKKADTFVSNLNSMYVANPSLRDPDGKPNGIVKQRMEMYQKQGLPIEFKDGQFILQKKSDKFTGKKADLAKLVANIKDPSMQQKALNRLRAQPDDKVDDAFVNQFSATAKQFSGAK